MAALPPPACDFGRPAPNFALPGVDGRIWTLADCRGTNGLLVMFICQHCPYVQAIHDRIVRDTRELLGHGIASVAIMSNDATAYPDDSFEHMRLMAERHNYPFPYLYDETQAVAQAFGAVCTPDFFGYNAELHLQYRGRLDASRTETAPADTPRDLFLAMTQIAATGHGPEHQEISIGCSIKWKNP